MEIPSPEIEKEIEKEGETLRNVIQMMGKRLVGQSHVAERLVMGL